jgi:hypothetical protein
MNLKVLIALSVIVLILLLPIIFHFSSQKSEEEKVKDACIQLCRKALIEGKDLSKGPCLANPLENFREWVCDVAHNPRQDVDNLPENQCSAFRDGLAKHFVEVDPSCKLIRIY